MRNLNAFDADGGFCVRLGWEKSRRTYRARELTE